MDTLSKLLRPTLSDILKVGMVDFYAFLLVAVALLMGLPDGTSRLLWSILLAIFIISDAFTLTGFARERLYREFEGVSALFLQLAFTGIIINVLL
ncbi:hypothetical protein [Levilactobacillus paucivorans]|nr:hypothetical protein [Levilactobacillus paucivorans]